MAKTISSPDDTKKQRKKLAKREAKTMLKLDEARKGVQKAEGKVAKAQAQLEASRTDVRDLEAALAEMSTERTTTRVSTEESGNDDGTERVVSLSAAEGGIDIAPEQQPAEESTERATTNPFGSRVPAHTEDEASADKAVASAPVMENPSDIPAPAEPETAWPPMETRKEVLHAAEEAQAGLDDGQQQKSTRNTSRRRRGQTHTEK